MQKSKQFLQFLKSLKFRLILLIVVIAVVPSLILSAAVLKYYEKRAVSIRESEILSQAKILANQIATSEYMKLGADVSSSNIQTQIDMLTTIYDGRVIVVDDNCKVYYDTYNLDDHKLIIAEEVMRSFKGEDIVHYDSENHYIEMTIPISDPDDKSETVIGVMLISVSTDNIVINQSYMRQVAVIVMVMVGIAIVFFAILLLLYFLKPLQKIEEGIAAIKNGYGEYNLQVNDYTETAGICEKINQMLGRIKVMDDSRQEFVSNVSHELKTPLTSMKVLADSINSMPDAPKELYQEFMEDITNEIERETKIINDLLSLVKMDKSAAGLNVSSVNINELLEQILNFLRTEETVYSSAWKNLSAFSSISGNNNIPHPILCAHISVHLGWFRSFHADDVHAHPLYARLPDNLFPRPVRADFPCCILYFHFSQEVPTDQILLR
jgi:methyl-accepting chemotaxis protein